MNIVKFALPLVAGVVISATPGLAAPLLQQDLATFSVLGASTVTNTGATTLTGDIGVSPGTAITGKETITVNGTNAGSDSTFVHENDALAQSAQGQFVTASDNLRSLSPDATLAADLAGLTLNPGVYNVLAGTTNLNGTLTLDGLGNANAAWVFLMESTLITSPFSSVEVINTGDGAGIFWDVASSATLDDGTSFQGNILSEVSISLNGAATIECGRALAHTGAVTMINNTIGGACEYTTQGDTYFGFNGGLDVTTEGGETTVGFLPFVPVDGGPTPISEPLTLLLFGMGFAGVLTSRKKLFSTR